MPDDGTGMMRGPGMMMQMPTQGMVRGCMMGIGPMMMMGGPGQHFEGRLAFLKTELGITPAQEQVWNAYAEAFRASASTMQGIHEQMRSGGIPSAGGSARMAAAVYTWIDYLFRGSG